MAFFFSVWVSLLLSILFLCYSVREIGCFHTSFQPFSRVVSRTRNQWKQQQQTRSFRQYALRFDLVEEKKKLDALGRDELIRLATTLGCEQPETMTLYELRCLIFFLKLRSLSDSEIAEAADKLKIKHVTRDQVLFDIAETLAPPEMEFRKQVNPTTAAHEILQKLYDYDEDIEEALLDQGITEEELLHMQVKFQQLGSNWYRKPYPMTKKRFRTSAERKAWIKAQQEKTILNRPGENFDLPPKDPL